MICGVTLSHNEIPGALLRLRISSAKRGGRLGFFITTQNDPEANALKKPLLRINAFHQIKLYVKSKTLKHAQ